MNAKEIVDIVTSKLSDFNIESWDGEYIPETNPPDINLSIDCSLSLSPQWGDLWIELQDNPMTFSFNNATIKWGLYESNKVNGGGVFRFKNNDIFIKGFYIRDFIDFYSAAEECDFE